MNIKKQFYNDCKLETFTIQNRSEAREGYTLRLLKS